jgi:hypothetical protein
LYQNFSSTDGCVVTEFFVPVEIFIIGTDMCFICLTCFIWNDDSYKDVDADISDNILCAAINIAFI